MFLELHGAMATESHDDGEAELLRRIRAAVGPDVPILASLDLHANVSPEMVELADFFSSYRTYPHVDWGASGARCAEWLDRVLAWSRPARALRQVPFLVPVTAGCTYVEPAGGLYEELKRIEAATGVHLSLNMGFPPADIRDVGPSVTAYGPDQESVDAAAERLLAAVLAAEGAFAAHRPLSVADAVAEAMRIARTASRPVVLADTQDNPGAGAPSNTTGLIAELLRQGATRAAVGIVHDPAAAAAAHGRGVGATLDRLGGGPGDGPGQQPLPGPWRVAALSDGRFRGTSPMLRVGGDRHGADRAARAERRRSLGRHHPAAAGAPGGVHPSRRGRELARNPGPEELGALPLRLPGDRRESDRVPRSRHQCRGSGELPLHQDAAGRAVAAEHVILP